MQTVWKGSISFGLVSIPVRLVSATEEKDVSFRQVHAVDGGRIRYRRVCEKDGEEVAYADIAKGYELPDGEMVILTSDDLADLPVASSRAVEVLGFVPFSQIDPTALARAYYVEPTGDAKPYVLLRDSLEQSGRVGVVKVALRNRERLAILRAHEGVLVVQTMLWPDEIRQPEFGFLSEKVEVRDQEMAMAESYIETLSGDFEPEQYSDEYRTALLELIDAKAEGGGSVAPPAEEPTEGKVVDLMEALRRSVEQAKDDRGGGQRASGGAAATETGPAKSASKSGQKKASGASTAKKAPAKKAPAKKTAAKKTAKAAKKSSAAKQSEKETGEKARKSA
ncbi:Ku protein [Actinobacteria bacterium YIM 96077]|uniref:Non-homologous end joining protein Ku n=1 Tax=Phytoactinopolyspora halophila TaxID=1981511 RepID=A0A329QRB2_9ACTN|nr:Ku protein [Phytoactinopolyspora halophila]AYY12984.1 Ku protein [Actinobacteria bacterium YIM 96077]RAW13248.1 Ku protein [Phytoactinopolyspora halophila]